MKNIAVIYKTKYGSTKKYAQWISEALNCALIDASNANKSTLLDYDIIIYGGGLYASGINGISLITKNYDMIKNKKLIVFTVGLADPKIKSQFKPIIDKNFTEEMKQNIDIFHLRGAINYKELGLTHKAMMSMLKKVVEKKDDSEKTEEDKMMLSTYGTQVDFTDINSIEPVLTCIRSYM